MTRTWEVSLRKEATVSVIADSEEDAIEKAKEQAETDDSTWVDSDILISSVALKEIEGTEEEVDTPDGPEVII